MSEIIDEEYAQPVEEAKGKRKRGSPDNWVKRKKRAARNSAESRGKPSITCEHQDTARCSAGKLTDDDIQGLLGYFLNK